MDTIYLVSCVSKKHTDWCAARDMYQSAWFKKAREYVGDRQWAILSAKHGLLPVDAHIPPYDYSLHDMTTTQRKEWGEWVAGKLDNDKHYVFLAGQKYREYITPFVESWEAPLAGLGIGQQLAWFDRNTSREQ